MRMILGLSTVPELLEKLELNFQIGPDKICPHCQESNYLGDFVSRYHMASPNVLVIPLCKKCGEALWTYRGAMFNWIKKRWEVMKRAKP